MPEENRKTRNFFKRLISSVKDFEIYQTYATEKTRTALKYLVILMMIFSCIIGGVYTYKITTYINKGITFFEDNIHELIYKENNLSINSGEEIKIINPEEMLQVIIVNTSATEEKKNEYSEEISKYHNGIVLLNDRMIYKNQLLSKNIEYEYSNIANIYGINELNKEDVKNVIDGLNNINIYSSLFIVTFIYLFIIYFTSAIVDIVMLGILGFVVSRIVGIKMRYKASFNMGVYALTLPIILNLIYIIVNIFTAYEVKYFGWMYTTISYIYMIVAILLIKSDLINKQIELMKIVEEQEKVKKELQEQEERKKEEEKEKTKDDNENKKEENKEEKKKPKERDVGDSGLAPQE